MIPPSRSCAYATGASSFSLATVILLLVITMEQWQPLLMLVVDSCMLFLVLAMVHYTHEASGVKRKVGGLARNNR
jgi:hypothetical protein